MRNYSVSQIYFQVERKSVELRTRRGFYFSRIIFKVDKLSSISFGNLFSAIGINMFIGYFSVPALIRDTLVWLSDKDAVSIITEAVTFIGFTKRISVSIFFPSIMLIISF